MRKRLVFEDSFRAIFFSVYYSDCKEYVDNEIKEFKFEHLNERELAILPPATYLALKSGSTEPIHINFIRLIYTNDWLIANDLLTEEEVYGDG